MRKCPAPRTRSYLSLPLKLDNLAPTKDNRSEKAADKHSTKRCSHNYQPPLTDAGIGFIEEESAVTATLLLSFFFAFLVTSIAIALSWDFYIPARTSSLLLGTPFVFVFTWLFAFMGLKVVSE